MNRIKKKFNDSLKGEVVPSSCAKGSTTSLTSKKEVDTKPVYGLHEDFIKDEFNSFSEWYNPNTPDLEYENACLQKLIRNARMEQKQLKNEIRELFIKD